MAAGQYPKDENLRLILSADQDQWLRQRIRESRIFILVMAILLALGVTWLTINFADTVSWYEGPDCLIIDGNADVDQAVRDAFLAAGLTPCPPENSPARGIAWDDVRAAGTFLSMLLIVVTIPTIFRHLYLLWRNKGYLKDHRAFLKKYNRL